MHSGLCSSRAAAHAGQPISGRDGGGGVAPFPLGRCGSAHVPPRGSGDALAPGRPGVRRSAPLRPAPRRRHDGARAAVLGARSRLLDNAAGRRSVPGGRGGRGSGREERLRRQPRLEPPLAAPLRGVRSPVAGAGSAAVGSSAWASPPGALSGSVGGRSPTYPSAAVGCAAFGTPEPVWLIPFFCVCEGDRAPVTDKGCVCVWWIREGKGRCLFFRLRQLMSPGERRLPSRFARLWRRKKRAGLSGWAQSGRTAVLSPWQPRLCRRWCQARQH